MYLEAFPLPPPPEVVAAADGKPVAATTCFFRPTGWKVDLCDPWGWFYGDLATEGRFDFFCERRVDSVLVDGYHRY